MLVSVLAVPALLYVVILIPAIQTRVVRYFASELSRSLHTEISIGRIHLIPFKQVVVNDFLVRDRNSDTLLFVPRFNASIDSIHFKQHRIYLKRISMIDPVVKIHKVDSTRYNFSFITDLFSKAPQVPDSLSWKVLPLSISIVRGKGKAGFRKPGTVDWDVHDFQLQLHHMQYRPDSLSFQLGEFAFSESHGVVVSKAKARVGISKHWLGLSDWEAENSQSYLRVDSLMVDISPKETTAELFNRTSLYFDVTLLKLAPSDLGLITGLPRLPADPLTFSGVIRGRPDNLKGDHILLGFGHSSALQVSFDLKGLPDWYNSFLYFDFHDFTTNIGDLSQMVNLALEKPIELPESILGLGDLHYTGNVTGFFNDLVAFGKMETQYGQLFTDLGIKVKDDHRVYFSGGVSAKNFNVDALTPQLDDFGRLDFSAQMSGSYLSEDDYFAFLEGTIQTLEYKGYPYANVVLSGLINPRRFDGQVKLNDPNGNIHFMGQVDYHDTIPVFAFDAIAYRVNLERMHLFPNLKDGLLSFGLNARFVGEDIDDVVGQITLSDFSLSGNGKGFGIDYMMLDISRNEQEKIIQLESDLFHGRLAGNYHFNHLPGQLWQLTRRFSPALAGESSYVPSEQHPNKFSFELEYRQILPLTQFIFPSLQLDASGRIWGDVDTRNEHVAIQGDLGNWQYGAIKGNALSFELDADQQRDARLMLNARSLTIPLLGELSNFSVDQNLRSDSLTTRVGWYNRETREARGNIVSQTHFKQTNGQIHSLLELLPSSIYLNDSIWNLAPSQIAFQAGHLHIDGFHFYSGSKSIRLQGDVSKDEAHELVLSVHDIDLGNLIRPEQMPGLRLDGLLNADMAFRNVYENPIVLSHLTIDELEVNNQQIGNLAIQSQWLPESRSIAFETTIQNGEQSVLQGDGNYSLADAGFDLDFRVNDLPVGFLEFYLSKVVQNIDGTASGAFHLGGTLRDPELTARMKLNTTRLDVDLLKTGYTISDSIILFPDRIYFKNMRIADKFQNKGVFSGNIYHSNFSNMNYDLRLECKNMLALDTGEKDNPDYYGTVFANGSMNITGKTSDILIDIAARSMPNTYFNIPLTDLNEASETSFIRFVKPASENSGTTYGSEQVAVSSNLELNFDLEITPDAKIQVIFDSKIGDLLKGSGSGDLNVRIDKQGKIYFFGEYVMSEGSYLFSLQNIINKRFLINQGSSVRWDGDPYDARIDLNATYKLKAAMYDLLVGIAGSDATNSDLKRRVPIHCNMLLTDRIMRPSIRFEIESPSTQDNNQILIDQYINTEEELNRQVISLLVLNKFFASEAGQAVSSRAGNSAALVTTTEVLSNQLSHWLSQISNDFDIGVSYRPGDEITNEEIEVALSTQIFNNRVLLNGNVGYGRNQTATSSIIGDFDVEVKLNNSGNVRAKAYTHSNNDLLYDTAPTTQGAGLSFREDFDTFGELLRKYWAVLTGEQRRKKKLLEQEE